MLSDIALSKLRSTLDQATFDRYASLVRTDSIIARPITTMPASRSQADKRKL